MAAFGLNTVKFDGDWAIHSKPAGGRRQAWNKLGSVTAITLTKNNNKAKGQKRGLLVTVASSMSDGEAVKYMVNPSKISDLPTSRAACPDISIPPFVQLAGDIRTGAPFFLLSVLVNCSEIVSSYLSCTRNH